MTLATVIWIASIADNLKFGTGLIGAILAVIACVLLGSSFDKDSTNPSKQRWYSKILFTFGALLLAFALIMPPTSAIYAMNGVTVQQQGVINAAGEIVK